MHTLLMKSLKDDIHYINVIQYGASFTTYDHEVAVVIEKWSTVDMIVSKAGSLVRQGQVELKCNGLACQLARGQVCMYIASERWDDIASCCGPGYLSLSKFLRCYCA